MTMMRNPPHARGRPYALTVLLAVAGAALAVTLAAPPASCATLFGLVSTGELYASADGGATWGIRSTLPVRDAVALVAGISSSELFLASESGGFYRSSDAGLNWSAIAAVPASDLAALVGAPGRLLLLTRTGSVYASTNAGTSWSAVGAIAASDVVSATHAAGTYHALTATGSVYRSLDAGAVWTAVGTLAVSDAVEIQAFGGDLYVLTATGDVARGTIGGTNWSFVSTLSQVGMTALCSNPGELVASTEAGEVAASSSGSSWNWRGVIGQLAVRSLANDRPTLVGVEGSGTPAFRLLAPWPNPARGRAALALDLAAAAEVTVSILDPGGRAVATPIRDEALPAGRTVRELRLSIPAGIYWVRARVGDQEQARRLVWLDGTPRR